MGDHTLFFYGTLMAPPVLYRVIYGSSSPDSSFHPNMNNLKVRPALLHGHRRHQVKDADYPAVIPILSTNTDGKEPVVRGNVVSGLTDGDIWRLDIFEGDQYERRVVECEILEGVGLDQAAPEANGQATSNANNDNTTTTTSVSSSKKSNSNSNSTTMTTVKAQTYIWIAPISELNPEEWDFEDFKRRKMSRWAGLAWDHEDYQADEEQDQDVQEDEGFAEVDRAVLANGEEVSEKKKDPTGGRGVEGAIGRQLKEAQNANGESA